MPYTVKSTEKTRKSCSDSETKALLYLMNLRSDSNEVHYFIVDFFNDLTGMDAISEKLWDVQSKASKTNSAKTIGRELVTLFKNYMCDFKFVDFILFIGGVSDSFRINNNLNSFGIENVTPKALKSVKEGLKEETKDKSYIKNKDVTFNNIDSFLNNVKFVVDDKKPSEYVKAIIKNHPKLIPEERVLDAIFNEIRDKQSSKKNTHNIEGIVIETQDEALNYFRHLTVSEIRLLVLQRLINNDPINQSIPFSFLCIINTCPPERQKDFIQECKMDLTRALFNKNSADAFWALLEEIYNIIINNPNLNVEQIFNSISKGIKKNAKDFNALSLKYFIPLVKDGIEQ